MVRLLAYRTAVSGAGLAKERGLLDFNNIISRHGIRNRVECNHFSMRSSEAWIRIQGFRSIESKTHTEKQGTIIK